MESPTARNSGRPVAPGEFSTALRAAIQHSHLSLQEIANQLRKNRTPVSASTLSYWQNGSNQPERTRSVAAVSVLERILDQPAGSLSDLIGPRKPRGRWIPRPGTSMAYDQLWKVPEAVVRALAKIDAGPEDLDHLAKVSQHLSYRIDHAGHEESVRVRRLVRADRDNVTRMIFITRCVTLSQPPMITFAEGCRPARFRADVPTSTCVFEFLLDRPMQTGDLAVVEFALRFPPGQTDRHAQIAVWKPTRELVVQVNFDPQMLPERCHAYWQPRSTLPWQHKGDARVDAKTPVFQYIALDPPPGQYGITWQWR
ncbi:hypothetical protein [Dactylosporangium roseum]